MKNIIGEWAQSVGAWADSAYGSRGGWGGVNHCLSNLFGRSSCPPTIQQPPARRAAPPTGRRPGR